VTSIIVLLFVCLALLGVIIRQYETIGRLTAVTRQQRMQKSRMLHTIARPANDAGAQ
jgi:hypothetical protein